MSGRPKSLDELPMSAATRKLNQGLLPAGLAEEHMKKLASEKPLLAGPFEDVPKTKIPVKRRLRQDTKGPNKLEQEFEAFLREEWRTKKAHIHPQGLTLTLANGVRYTPDFIVAVPCVTEVETTYQVEGRAAVMLLAFETKGFMREDASVKIKVAARLYPWIKFHLVTKRRKKDGGGWDIEEVLT